MKQPHSTVFASFFPSAIGALVAGCVVLLPTLAAAADAPAGSAAAVTAAPLPATAATAPAAAPAVSQSSAAAEPVVAASAAAEPVVAAPAPVAQPAAAPRAPSSSVSPASPATPAPVAVASAPATPAAAAAEAYRLGAYADIDLGILFFLSQGAGMAAGVVVGPFRAGLSYATFLSNKDFGGTPSGFTLRANYIVGINAAYFIGQSTDQGPYVQAMFHIKQQGVTNIATGDHKDLNSLAAGLEIGYVWKFYRGLYVCPRLGALYYVKSPQGPSNKPIRIGNRDYNNGRHKIFDTYLIPTLNVGYSW